jgi:anti-sigma regulatory factor (Ser/Thr protein kinase)
MCPAGENDSKMTASPTAFRHNAFVYDSQEEYVERSVAFLREGLEAGEGAIVAHTRPGLAVMREALGSDAADVRFVDVSYSYTRPPRTLAAYHTVYAEELEKNALLRCVADVQFGPDAREWDLWMGYEALFNRTFEELPAWVLCTYDVNGLPDSMIEGVWRTHPEVVAENGWNTSDLYEDPDAFLRRVTDVPEPLPDLREIGFGRDLEEFRERLARELVAAKVPKAKVVDTLVAATEVATNAIEHGGGVEEVLVGSADGRFVCEIVDRGSGFDDLTAGYLAPREGVGRGLWVARQLTWQIDFFESPRGFTARIWL